MPRSSRCPRPPGPRPRRSGSFPSIPVYLGAGRPAAGTKRNGGRPPAPAPATRCERTERHSAATWEDRTERAFDPTPLHTERRGFWVDGEDGGFSRRGTRRTRKDLIIMIMIITIMIIVIITLEET